MVGNAAEARAAAICVWITAHSDGHGLTAQGVLQRIVRALEQAGIPYMLTGSFASSYHGSPRATQDIDIVISATPEHIDTLARLLPADEWYMDRDAALGALRDERQFNVISRVDGWKVDLICKKTRSFSAEEFKRRETVEFEGMKLSIATAEDVLLSKLEWAKRGGSLRQIEDASQILGIRSDELDRKYLLRWVALLDLSNQWQEACRLAEIAP